MKSSHEERSRGFLRLRPRYHGSCAAMIYGLAMAVYGHVRTSPILSSLGELVLYGGLLYQARKRQRFQKRNTWLALEVYASFSLIWMAVNILKTQLWRWHPIVLGWTPLIVMGGYLIARFGKPFSEVKTRGVPAHETMPKQILLMIAVAAAWAILNIYAFPKMQIMT